MKILRFTLALFYDTMALLYCCVFLINIFYGMKIASVDEASISIIGGADLPTSIFLMQDILSVIFPFIFNLLNIATAFILTITTLKNKTDRKINILLFIFIGLSLMIFLLIPFQSYTVAFYFLLRKILFLQSANLLFVISSLVSLFYVIISLANAVIIFLPKKFIKDLY